MRKAVTRALVLMICAGVSAPAFARCASGVPYQQTEAVQRRYPDPAVQLDTPAFAAGKKDFTTHDELTHFLAELERSTDNLLVRRAGHSQEGRPIPALLFSSSGRFAPSELRGRAKPVVFMVGQAHGNEPAGGEAMLAVARALATGELKPLLEHVSVVIVPRANPDGAHYFWRATANCVDINRDYIKVDLPETMAILRLANEVQPDVFVDTHEFSVATRWVEKFNGVQSYDFLMAYATHPNIAPALTHTAEQIFSRALARDVERAGYSHFWYYTTSYNVKDKRVVGGGTAPDIGRNYAGLRNALSFLIESRGVGIGRESFARRVHTQYLVMASLLRTTAENAQSVRKIVQAAREETIRRGRDPSPGDTVAVTLKNSMRQQALTLLDPQSGEPKEVNVEWSDPREAQAGLVRSRPYAYLVLPSHTEVARRLEFSGIGHYRLRRAVELEVESYEVTDRRAGAVFVEGHIRSSVTTEVRTLKRLFPAGTFVFPMAQPGANILVAALEPESASSFVALGVVPTDQRGLANPLEAAPTEVPIYRLLRPAVLETSHPATNRTIAGWCYFAVTRVAVHLDSALLLESLTVPSILSPTARPVKSRRTLPSSKSENVMVSPRSLPLPNCRTRLSALALPPIFWYCCTKIVS